MRLVTLTLLAAMVLGSIPDDNPCVTWQPFNSSEPLTNVTNLMLDTLAWAHPDNGNCLDLANIYVCFASTSATWGHRIWLGFSPAGVCRTVLPNGTAHEAQHYYLPMKGPQWMRWEWKLAQTGSAVPSGAVQYANRVLVRSLTTQPGSCAGDRFPGWSDALSTGILGDAQISVGDLPWAPSSFAVGACMAQETTVAPQTSTHPTPATPGPTAAPPTLPPDNKPYIRFGNAIPTANRVDAVITQGNTSYSWNNYAFAQFSTWVELFASGTGELSIYENVNGQRGVLQSRIEFMLTPGPLVVVTKGSWPPTNPYTSIETIAASYVPFEVGSGVRLFNLSPDTSAADLIDSTTNQTLARHIAFGVGSAWAPVSVSYQTFTVTDTASGKSLATQQTTPPDAPFVFTLFLLGLQNSTAGSVYTTQVVALIDAPGG